MGAQWLRYQNDPATTQPLYRSCPTQPIVKTAGFFYARTTKINNVIFAHQSVCNSPIALLMKAINAGFLHGAPNFDAHTVQKYLLASPATSKGHMKRPHKGIRSTTPKHAITAPNIYLLLTPQRVNIMTMPGLEYNDEEDVLPIPPLHNLMSERLRMNPLPKYSALARSPTKYRALYMLIPKWKQTLFGNGDSPYGNILLSLPISVRGLPIWKWGAYFWRPPSHALKSIFPQILDRKSKFSWKSPFPYGDPRFHIGI